MPLRNNTVILDANIILRFLLNDNISMAEKAAEYIENERAIVTTEVIAEVVYVLKGVYSLDRKKISDVLVKFMELVRCRDRDEIILALAKFGSVNLDFVDCILYAYNKLKGIKIATFDNKLLKLLSEE